jgi:hypothetical protein
VPAASISGSWEWVTADGRSLNDIVTNFMRALRDATITSTLSDESSRDYRGPFGHGGLF